MHVFNVCSPRKCVSMYAFMYVCMYVCIMNACAHAICLGEKTAKTCHTTAIQPSHTHTHTHVKLGSHMYRHAMSGPLVSFNGIVSLLFVCSFEEWAATKKHEKVSLFFFVLYCCIPYESIYVYLRFGFYVLCVYVYVLMH